MQDRISKVNQAVQTIGGREGKYLTFTLAGEEYGIGILKIREIIGKMPITSVPQARISSKTSSIFGERSFRSLI